GVAVVIDPIDYKKVLADIDGPAGQPSYALRLALAAKVYAHTAAYDGAIAGYLSSLVNEAPAQNAAPERTPWPTTFTLQMKREQTLRYGENP
ncbi:MAG TPA: bifunctional phosphoribosylaminoimidazolecarboxamide formyltransferase/inosine monophosphate cyclohydrolase, partial [Pusillimonas sp.]|nr:bifunctional phosphoribosylaminoimidazolecarboxamide formyltransferase/inosine monophosphate cyclohydrolase [Pusillimonas sp.]